MIGKADPAQRHSGLRAQDSKGQCRQPDPFSLAPVFADQRPAKTELGDLPQNAKDHAQGQREPDSRLLWRGVFKTELLKHLCVPLTTVRQFTDAETARVQVFCASTTKGGRSLPSPFL